MIINSTENSFISSNKSIMINLILNLIEKKVIFIIRNNKRWVIIRIKIWKWIFMLIFLLFVFYIEFYYLIIIISLNNVKLFLTHWTCILNIRPIFNTIEMKSMWTLYLCIFFILFYLILTYCTYFFFLIFIILFYIIATSIINHFL